MITLNFCSSLSAPAAGGMLNAARWASTSDIVSQLHFHQVGSCTLFNMATMRYTACNISP